MQTPLGSTLPLDKPSILLPLLIVVVVEQARGESWGEFGWKRRGWKGGQLGIVRYLMGWANGRTGAGWVEYMVVIPG